MGFAPTVHLDAYGEINAARAVVKGVRATTTTSTTTVPSADAPQVVTTLAVDISGFDALDPAAANALTEPTADLSALPPAAAAAVSGCTVGQVLKSS